jgi:hypothetical protein
MAFLAIKKTDFDALFLVKGFVQSHSGKEITYERESVRMPGLTAVVFSSIAVDDDQVRPVGSDAVRFALVWRDPKNEKRSIGIYSAKTVARAGKDIESVMARIWEHANELGQVGKKMGAMCEKCGAPRYGMNDKGEYGNCSDWSCRKGSKSARR